MNVTTPMTGRIQASMNAIILIISCNSMTGITASENQAFHPGGPMFDTSGRQIDAHGGGFLFDSDRYYWYGSARLNHPDPPGDDKGINLYSSSDLYNWRYESLVVKYLNISVSENGQDLERPKVT